MKRIGLLVAASVVTALLAAAGPAKAQQAGGGEARPWVWTLAPSSHFYPLYLADPRRAQSALLLMEPVSTDVPESDALRFAIRLGGRFPILRVHPAGEPDRGWQLDFAGGFLGQFDSHHSLDNIGWDGLYGLLATYKPRPALGFRFGVLHDSAHVGDEYEERTGRRRLGYTREELVAGAAWQVGHAWLVYGEVGHMYNEVKPFQEPLRLQAGAQYESGAGPFGPRRPWYAAVDLTSFEENDWQVKVTAQLGVMVPVGDGDNRYRFAVEVGDGRSELGEFFLYDDTYVALGWYFDF